MDKIMLIDGHNAIHRACVNFGPPREHALCSNNCPHTSTHSKHCLCNAKWDVEDNKCYGEKYTFIFNFFRNLRPLIEDGSPDKVFFIMEGRPKFRYDLFPEYKANRLVKYGSKQEVVDKFHSIKNEIIRLLQYLPITIVRAENYEADDVIGTLAENMKEEDLTVISNDSDFIQLLQRGYKHITIYNPMKKEVMVAPTYPYIVWKSLAGDKADNIPGLLKPKKALETVNSPELFKKFMSVEENHANFGIHLELIRFSPVPEEELIFKEGIKDFVSLKQEFAKMDFQSIINEKSWEKYTSTFDCLRY